MNAAELYDRDFAEWAVRNAELLRPGRVAEADLDHIAEERFPSSWPYTVEQTLDQGFLPD
jgi:hypothetical protein